MSKPYDLGMICGRFQHIHVGHQDLIETALKLCDRVLILVGSAQESCTERNPYDICTRVDMIKEVYPFSFVMVKPLSDLTTEDDITPAWGEYLLKNVQRIQYKKPEIMVYGNDESRSRWFAQNDIKDITEVIVNRGRIPISATMMREFLVNDDKESWHRFADPKLHKYYDRLREELLSVPFYHDKALSCKKKS